MIFKTLIPAAIIAASMAVPAGAEVGLPEMPGMAAPTAYAPSGTSADVAALQKRIDELLNQAQATKESADRLNSSIDRLLNSTGVRFGGEAVGHSISFTRFPTAGASAGTVARSWPSVGYLDFKIMARPKPELSAEVVYRMEKVFGGYWGSLDISGVRRFNIHGDTAIGFDVGMFNYKNTPLTVWAPQDRYPFEIDILARKRKEGMAQLYMGDNTWPLHGARVDATLLLFSSVDLGLEAIGVRTAIAGNKNTGLSFAKLFPYDQYLVGGRATLSGANSQAFKLGASYFEILESQDTSILPVVSNQLRSNVVGADIELKLLGDEVVLKAEGANSSFNFAYGKPVSWTTGGAGNAAVDIKGGSYKVRLHGLYVDEKFINYAAQTRTHAPEGDALGDIPTGNNLFDPREGDYDLNTVTNTYFTQYNNAIFATNQDLDTSGGQYAKGGYYLAPGARNRALPYGWATPNRAGYGVDAELSLMDGMLKPKGLFAAYAEPYQAYWLGNVGIRRYTVGGGGLALDFAPALGLPLVISGGWVVEDTKGETTVAYTVQTGDVNLRWEAFKGVFLVAGWEQISAYGLDVPINSTPLNIVIFDSVWTIHAVGLEWALSKSSDFFLTYVHHDLWMPSLPQSTYGAEEFEAKLALRF